MPSEPDGFLPLADAAAPPMPTEEAFRRLLGRVRALVARGDAKPFIASASLKRTTLERLNEVVAPPACGPLLAELDGTVAAWRAEPRPASHIMVVVLPPCDENAIVETWATGAGHEVLAAPTRDALIAAAPPPAPDLSGDGLLVVPRLEAWFLRHRDGLRAVRALLAALDGTRRPVVVGCNSWAWSFLAKAAGADLLLPDPVTFRPFDATRLHGWLSQLAEGEKTRAVRFRLSSTGEDVLARGDDGAASSKYLHSLAGRSLGIPWVAWHMWRRSLRSGEDCGVAADAAKLASRDDPGAETLWVAALDEYVLPAAQQQTALLVLHALLIHGALTAEDLRAVLPIVGESNIAPVLVKAGFIERQGEAFACTAASYPAIRDGLRAAGMPLGAI